MSGTHRNKISTNSYPYLWENFKRDSIGSTVILCKHCGEDIVDRDSSRSNAAVALLHMTGCKLLSIVHSNRYAVDTRIIDTNMAKREADPTSTDTLRNYLRMPSHPEMLATSMIRGFLNPDALDDPYVKARYECIKLPPNNGRVVNIQLKKDREASRLNVIKSIDDLTEKAKHLLRSEIFMSAHVLKTPIFSSSYTLGYNI